MLSIRRRTLLLTILLCFTVGVGSVQVQPFTAQIQQALQILGLWPYGIYTNGSVPTWNSTTNQFAPGGGAAGPSTATQFIASAGTTCAAPALTSTAAGTNGIAISATAVLTCVGGTARQTATATTWTTTVPVLLPDGLGATPTLAFTSQSTDGLFHPANNRVAVATAGVGRFMWISSETRMASDMLLSWTNNTDATAGTPDVVLAREGPGYLFRRNSTNAQRDCLANDYTSASNFSAYCEDFQSVTNMLLVGTRTAATGVARRAFFESQSDNAAGTYAGMSAQANSNPVIRVGLYTSGGTSPATTSTITEIVRLGEVMQTATSGTVTAVTIQPTYNQSASTAANTDLLVNRTQTAVGSGAQRLLQLQIGSVNKYYVSADGTAKGTQEAFVQATPPTCTAANNCGTGNGTFATGSSDTAGSVTLGTNPTSGFVITFNGTWVAAPVCDVWMNKAGMVVGKLPLTKVTTTTTITVVTNGTAPATGDIYAYRCTGLQ